MRGHLQHRGDDAWRLKVFLGRDAIVKGQVIEKDTKTHQARRVSIDEATRELLREGGTVTVLPAESLLTPTEAAELLGVSRPYVARLIDAGTIPAERLTNSRHRRIRLRDLLTYQDHRQRQRESRTRAVHHRLGSVRAPEPLA